MNLLCRLGRHRPRGIPRWNDGYYFATCDRCGSDLVRTAFQRWHVPDGYRVVWSDRPPVNRPEVALIPGAKSAPRPFGLPEAGTGPAHRVDAPAAIGPPEPAQEPLSDPAAPARFTDLPAEAPAPPAEAAGTGERLPADPPVPPAGSGNNRLPIQDVLARLNAEDAANRTPEPSAPAIEAPAQRRRSTWDFMEEDPSKVNAAAAQATSPGAPARPPAFESPPGAVSGEVDAADSTRPGGGERVRRIRSAVRNFWSGPGEPKPVLVVALALAVAVVVALALALPSAPSTPGDRLASSQPGGGPRPGMGEVPDPFATDAVFEEPEAEGPPRQGARRAGAESSQDRAYVAASLLSCRAAPVLQARRVRNLARGQEVRVLAIEGEWASLTYRGGQCWAQARFISPVPPL